ncbi:undecaprenyl-diphosphate phosphatase [Thermoactinomyces sp. DSM 45891]|uniref:undecaprenyl-diphosphate phosphatase n=1 Tax=Thermoactinomyces sp. DSM 45891 TaxID=1761907 RepID=UPI0009317211|nr:undecaprenyl-diphosphate phosphatase [Thermoactinomyces sp. DSM 45891]
MNLWEIFVAFVLGIVEGLTEFAPVSSTGHMILVDDMFLHSDKLFSKEVATSFKVVIQLGSILAVVIVFKERFMNLLGLKKDLSVAEQGQKLNLKHVIVGMMPAAVLGFLFKDYIDDLFSAKRVVIGLAAGGLLMIVADWFRPSRAKVKTVDQITYKHAIGIGLFQCIALWPGFSRSGSTMSGGVLMGLGHRAAADFTFIMAVPVMFGASALSLVKGWSSFTIDALPFFIVGFISAFIFALISIRFFLKLINKIKLAPFGMYRIVLAAIIYFFCL